MNGGREKVGQKKWMILTCTGYGNTLTQIIFSVRPVNYRNIYITRQNHKEIRVKIEKQI